MSWKRSGQLISGPPALSDRPAGPAQPDSGSARAWGPRIVDRLRQNTGGLNAFQRERQLVARYGDREGRSGGAGQGGSKGRTEWDVLRENHRFIRDDEHSGEVSWEERLARAYESKLFKEYALIDLKHYKSKRFALRWRTAPEVVEGVGEETCGSLRCRYHRRTLFAGGASPDSDSDSDSDEHGGEGKRHRKRSKRDHADHRRKNPKPPSLLRAFELPFVYQEAGERKEALVKVRLCRRCEGKLRWKPEEERERRRRGREESGSEEEEDESAKRGGLGGGDEEEEVEDEARGGKRSSRDVRRHRRRDSYHESGGHDERRKPRSASPSPRRDRGKDSHRVRDRDRDK